MLYVHYEKLLELINEFIRLRIKSNVQRSVAFLLQIVKQQKEIKKTVLFTFVPKTVRYLGVNQTKGVKDLCSENYRTLMKEIVEKGK